MFMKSYSPACEPFPVSLASFRRRGWRPPAGRAAWTAPWDRTPNRCWRTGLATAWSCSTGTRRFRPPCSPTGTRDDSCASPRPWPRWTPSRSAPVECVCETGIKTKAVSFRFGRVYCSTYFVVCSLFFISVYVGMISWVGPYCRVEWAYEITATSVSYKRQDSWIRQKIGNRSMWIIAETIIRSETIIYFKYYYLHDRG